MTTGERIKQRRVELGISADKLAEQIGVSRSTMFRYESGSIEKMPMNNLVPIASALNTTIEYLMGWTNEEESAPTAVSSEEDALNQELISRLVQLTPAELEKVDAFVQGILASR